MSGLDVELARYVRSIPDFPKPGIVFRDITPLLASPEGLALAIDGLVEATRDLRPDVVIGELGAGFVLARKPGVLPYETVRADYSLEYGADSLELHADAFGAGARVLIHDDLLATGGTAHALCELVGQLGGEVVGCAFLIELAFLDGRARLAPHETRALISYDAE
jgi:adenine phosphoribosyltransferase